MKKILEKEQLRIIKKIEKGWSNDSKYLVEKEDGEKCLLRVGKREGIKRKEKEISIMKRAWKTGISMVKPLKVSVCEEENSSYLLQSWCVGRELEDEIGELSEREQYQQGIEAGIMLKKLHKLVPVEEGEPWESFYNKKTDKRILEYKACGIRLQDDETLIRYIQDNRKLIVNRPKRLVHGDYHIGNMILNKDGRLCIIDFNRCGYGDPWEEFIKIPFNVEKSPFFAVGQLNGYFQGEPPKEFFNLLSFYLVGNIINSVYWAKDFGEKEVKTMLKQASMVQAWYHNDYSITPEWYTKVKGELSNGN